VTFADIWSDSKAFAAEHAKATRSAQRNALAITFVTFAALLGELCG
jgi:hypothetical protein